MGALRRLQEKGANFTSTLSRPFSLYAVFLDCRGPYLHVREPFHVSRYNRPGIREDEQRYRCISRNLMDNSKPVYLHGAYQLGPLRLDVRRAVRLADQARFEI